MRYCQIVQVSKTAYEKKSFFKSRIAGHRLRQIAFYISIDLLCLNSNFLENNEKIINTHDENTFFSKWWKLRCVFFLLVYFNFLRISFVLITWRVNINRTKWITNVFEHEKSKIEESAKFYFRNVIFRLFFSRIEFNLE